VLVVTLVADHVPPPLATANVTDVPGTALPYASLIDTTSGLASAVPTFAVWLLPDTIAIVAGAPGLPVAVNVIGEPVRPVALTLTLFGPATGPRMSTVFAWPCASVIAVAVDS